MTNPKALTALLMLPLIAKVIEEGKKSNFEEGPKDILRKMANDEYEDMPSMPDVLKDAILKSLDKVGDMPGFPGMTQDDDCPPEEDFTSYGRGISTEELFGKIFGENVMTEEQPTHNDFGEMFEAESDFAPEPPVDIDHEEGISDDGHIIVEIQNSDEASNLLPTSILDSIPDDLLDTLDSDPSLRMKMIVTNPTEMHERRAEIELEMQGLQEELDEVMDNIGAADRCIQHLAEKEKAQERERAEVNHVMERIAHHSEAIVGHRDEIERLEQTLKS